MSKADPASQIAQLKVILKAPFAIHPELSPKAKKIATLAAVQNASMADIATELGFSVPTVAQYLREIKVKTGLSKSDLPGELIRQIRKVVEGK